MFCVVCGAEMRELKPWLYRCRACNIFSSTLKPAAGTGVPGLEELRRQNFEVMFDRLEALSPLSGVRILEVGSAWGWFLEAAQNRGAKAQGIEPEQANAVRAREKGLKVEIGFFPQDLADRGPYDIIVFNDVFEHLSDPVAVAKQTAQLLKPSGILVINLPSSDGILFKIATALDALGAGSWLDRLWQKGFPSPHVSYFNPQNLRHLVETNTDLRQVQAFSLDSVSRHGLAARITTSHRLFSRIFAIAGLWCLSFILPSLPADIHVAVFRKN
jgi:2-polyprenyl-3-methyl-5-hydroxy-6-metoxy-1,4-benzoquinol methylase